MHPEAGHILVTRDPRDTIGEHSGCPFHDNCLEGLIAGPGVKKRWGGKSAGDMADDSEAMDLLAGYLAQALMTYILCYAPQKIVIGGGVADHTPIVPLARKKCAEMLNGYIVTPEMAFARAVADKVIFMDGGVIVEQGAPEAVFGDTQQERTKQFLARYNERP